MMKRDETIEKVLDAALSQWHGELSLEIRGKLQLFIGEQLKWIKIFHTVGRNEAEKTLADQIRDSLEMLQFSSAIFVDETGSGVVPGAGAVERAGAVSHDGRNEGTGAGECRVVDIGTGFGFPGFVWKIVEDGLDVTLVERKERAATFLERLAFSMKLSGLAILRCDAEKDEIPGKFHVVTSKAAGRLGKMLPLAAKLLEPGGLYVTIKERDWKWELEGIKTPAMALLKEKTIDGDRGVLVAFRK